MAEPSHQLEQEVKAILNASFAEPAAEKADTQPPHTAEGQRYLDVDLYRLPDGVLILRSQDNSPPDQQAIESTPASQTTETPPQTSPLETSAPTEPEGNPPQQEPPPPSPESEKPGHQSRKGRLSSVLVPLVFLALLVGGMLSSLLLPPLTAWATVTITPDTKNLYQQATLTIAALPRANQVQGRALATESLTESKTVPATGRGHDDATRATGVITFYNSDSTPITIPAGVTFATAVGATVVTDKPASIQAAVPPLFGTAITPAHVVQAGSIGNIAARAIQTRCCGSAFVSATNTQAFSGGQDARDYRYVQASDIGSAAADLLATLTPQATAALTRQIQPGERLVTPLCTPTTIPRREAGAEAASVMVSVTQTCRSVAYSLDSLEQVATTLLAHAPGLTNYQQAGVVQVVVNGSTDARHLAQLQVSVSGIWMYHFSTRELTSLTRLIAGTSQQQARALLQRQPGVAHVTIQLRRLDWQDRLPSNPAHIQIVCFAVEKGGSSSHE